MSTPRPAPGSNSTKDPLETDARESVWWGQSCPLLVLADTLRARQPEKRAALIHLAGVFVRHRPSCTATLAAERVR